MQEHGAAHVRPEDRLDAQTERVIPVEQPLLLMLRLGSITKYLRVTVRTLRPGKIFNPPHSAASDVVITFSLY